MRTDSEVSRIFPEFQHCNASIIHAPDNFLCLRQEKRIKGLAPAIGACPPDIPYPPDPFFMNPDMLERRQDFPLKREEFNAYSGPFKVFLDDYWCIMEKQSFQYREKLVVISCDFNQIFFLKVIN